MGSVPDAPTRKMAQARARELAVIAGRPACHVIQSDYEQAKRELTGESDRERQDAILDAADLIGSPARDSGGSSSGGSRRPFTGDWVLGLSA
jgi:hypothetical protein